VSRRCSAESERSADAQCRPVHSQLCVVPVVESNTADMADIDRQNLAVSKLQGIMTDLNMTTQQFATAISILFGEGACIEEHSSSADGSQPVTSRSRSPVTGSSPRFPGRDSVSLAVPRTTADSRLHQISVVL